jgi:hypothetical protein
MYITASRDYKEEDGDLYCRSEATSIILTNFIRSTTLCVTHLVVTNVSQSE